jgi:hypothetical protein
MADTKGTFNSREGVSPFRYFTSGAFKETLLGVHSFVVSPGIRRYSLNVRDTSLKYWAISIGLLLLAHLLLKKFRKGNQPIFKIQNIRKFSITLKRTIYSWYKMML